MKNSQKKERSAFAQSAVVLDQDFELLSQLGEQLENAELETEYGFNLAKKLLLKYSECGERVGSEIQVLAKELEAARVRAEKSASLVSARSIEIQKRHEEMEQIFSRFHSLGEMVRKVTETVSELSAGDKAALGAHIPEIQSKLKILSDEATQIQNEADQANMKTLKKDATALGQMLSSVSSRLKNISGIQQQVM